MEKKNKSTQQIVILGEQFCSPSLYATPPALPLHHAEIILSMQKEEKRNNKNDVLESKLEQRRAEGKSAQWEVRRTDKEAC